LTDEIPDLVRRLIESDDIEEVRRLRQQLNALIRARMDELRKRAATMASEIRKRDSNGRKQRA
jgi:C4-dicarboxylate-specific signal transduction histidine kinase